MPGKGVLNFATFFDDVRIHSTMTDIMKRLNSSFNLSQAFDLVLQNLSTDTKDKVYGLYGILARLNTQDLPPVDYVKSVQQVYWETTCAILRSDQSLCLLYLTGSQPQISDLPTWVPDYSSNSFIRFFALYDYRTSNGSSTVFSLVKEDTSLSVEGIVLDEISTQASSTSVCTAYYRQGIAARPNLSNADERYAAVTEMTRTFQSWLRHSRTVDCYPTGETPSIVFYKTLTQPLQSGSQDLAVPTWTKHPIAVFDEWVSVVTADTSQDVAHFHADIASIESNPDSAAIIDDYVRHFGCSRDPRTWSSEHQIRLVLRARNQALSNLQHDISLLTYQRTFFITRDGYMSVGPRWSRPGDRIALIAGLQLPFIVRKTGDKYNLIGPAYVHGIMKGERWNESFTEHIVLV